jgi:spore coat protein CotH
MHCRSDRRLPWSALHLSVGVFIGLISFVSKIGWAQTEAQAPAPPADERRPPFVVFGPPPGGAPIIEERKIVKDFDKDGNKQLNAEERQEAREFLKKNPARGPGPRPGGGPLHLLPGSRPPGGGFGPPSGFGEDENQEPAKPGARISRDDVEPAKGRDLYAADSLRTLFLDFERDDWEKELADFHGTDVEVPATLTVDGVNYPGVGVHFRGMSSYMMVKESRKRSLNVSLDFTDKKQRLNGYKTLNLLNANGDASFMSTALYSHIARQYMPAPKANFVRVVINGENWGVYANVQQFNKDFIQENFRTSKGARWKVRGSPGGQSGLDYVGEDIAEYKKRYEMKDGDADDWRALIALCKTLTETPLDQLEKALSPIMDIDEVLWFLALDNALINTDGYWIRASDYSLYRDKDGKFHVIPADMNEAFRPSGGPNLGRRGGLRRVGGNPTHPDDHAPPSATAQRNLQPPQDAPAPLPPPEGDARPRMQNLDVDPLHGLDDAKKPLRSRLLAVPSLRERYLDHVRTIAEKSLDWSKLGPVVAQYRALIEKEVESDTRKLATFAAFQAATSDTPPTDETRRGGHGAMNLREFAEKRSAYLLSRIKTLSQAAAK